MKDIINKIIKFIRILLINIIKLLKVLYKKLIKFNKKYKYQIRKVVACILIIFLLVFITSKIINWYKVSHAKIEVELSTEKIEVYSNTKVKDIIKNINGKITKNTKLDTSTLGNKEVEFEYINNDDIKLKYTIEYKVVDTTPPVISSTTSYTIYTGDDSNIARKLFCGDNYDDKPKCTIEGEYDYTSPGTYLATLKGVDSEGNISKHNLSIIVKDKNNTNSSSSNKTTNTQNTLVNYKDFNDVIEKYKNKNTSIGIDVSKWQGKIDFNKVKKSGVEFVYIRVGVNTGEEIKLDEQFERNIKGFNKVGIPVGIYFYSNASTKEEVDEEVKWILSKIKKYDVDLEVVFDWENWNNYRDYNMSFHSLSELYKEFKKKVEKAGYKSMLYGSKNYLNNIFYEVKDNNTIWVAHYTEKTDYEDYKVWQLCDNGKVNGIDNYVDIDIRKK